MCERIFQIVMKVPLGERRGKLRWKEEECSLNGFLDIMGSENPFTGTLLPGGRLEIEGMLKTLIRNIPFTAGGKIEGKNLTLLLTEPRHTYTLRGVEITENEKIL